MTTYLSGFSVMVRTQKGLEYQYQQCIKYKPGSNSTIQDKVDLRSYFRKKNVTLNFFWLMTIEPTKNCLKRSFWPVTDSHGKH